MNKFGALLCPLALPSLRQKAAHHLYDNDIGVFGGLNSIPSFPHVRTGTYIVYPVSTWEEKNRYAVDKRVFLSFVALESVLL